MTIEINGMAHVILTVSRFDVARDFYRKLLPQFGMKPVFDGDKFFYCVGGRTAIGIEPCDPALASERFQQQRVGLHHLCLRARSREDVDRCAMVLEEMHRLPEARVSLELARSLPNARFEWMPRGSRFIAEYSDRFNEALLCFLAWLGAASA